MQKYFFLLMSIVSSCVSRSNFEKELLHLQSQPIRIVPQCYMIDNYNGIVDSVGAANLKLIIYADSSECSSCKIGQMYLWTDYIKYAAKYNGRLRYYFIYSPSKNDIGYVQFTMKNNSLDCPVLLDTMGEFERLNPHLPKNKALHTFLLDENNNVILVGNPLRNKKIEELFYKIVEEKLGKPQEHSVKDNLN